jgi:hypothetical protein
MSTTTVTTVTASCPDYVKNFKTREAAEEWIASVEASGHCRHPHVINEHRAHVVEESKTCPTT